MFVLLCDPVTEGGTAQSTLFAFSRISDFSGLRIVRPIRLSRRRSSTKAGLIMMRSIAWTQVPAASANTIRFSMPVFT